MEMKALVKMTETVATSGQFVKVASGSRGVEYVRKLFLFLVLTALRYPHSGENWKSQGSSELPIFLWLSAWKNRSSAV